jgi:hypothetical protein
MTMTMLRRSMTATAIAALLLAPALAQSPTSPSPGMAIAPSGAASPGFVATQTEEQWLASKNLIGTKVIGPSNETVGSINDLLVDRNGVILAAVVGVGGFLHIGEKNVAVPFKSLELTRTSDTQKIAMRFTKDELQQAPAFKPLAPPPLPVATVPGGSMRPRTNGPATQ